MYHRICQYDTNDKYSVSANDFEKQIAYLHNNGFRTIIPEDIHTLSGSGNNKFIMITFDDGLESDYAAAYPILKKYGFKGACFVTTGFIGSGGYMNWEQVRKLKEESFSIQSHTQSHRFLEDLAESQVRDELNKSRAIIRDKIASNPAYFSCPGGRFNKRVIEIAKDLGYKGMFTSIPGYGNSKINNFSIFKRNIVTANISLKDYIEILNFNKQKIIGRKVNYYFKLFLKKIIGNKIYYFIWANIIKNNSVKYEK